MRAIKSNTINTNSVPPLFVSGEAGGILIRGDDGYLFVRGDIVTVCDSAECQTELEEDCLGSYSHIQAGDIVIRTDLNKSFKYTLASDGKTLNPIELIADTVEHTHEMYHKTWISETDPVLDKDNVVSAKDLWFNSLDGFLYFRYNDFYEGDCSEFIEDYLPEGCSPVEGYGDQWVRIQSDLHVDPYVFSDDVYHVDTLIDLDKLLGTKKGDLAVVAENNITYKHMSSGIGLTEWIEISHSSATHIVATLDEMISLPVVRQGDICIVKNTLTTYKNLIGDNGSYSDWQEIVSRGKSVVFFDDIDPALDPSNDVRDKDIWFDIARGVTYIRYPDHSDTGAGTHSTWVSLLSINPAISDDIFEVETKAEMLALALIAKKGDVCTVKQTNSTYKNNGTGWVKLLYANPFEEDNIALDNVRLYAQIVDPKFSDDVTLTPYAFWFNTDEKTLSILDSDSTVIENSWDWLTLVGKPEAKSKEEK